MPNIALNKSFEEPINNASEATNGIVSGYTGVKGFAFFSWPGTMTIDLGEIKKIYCIRFLLWDGLGKGGSKRDPRIYKYRLLTSTNHKIWNVYFDTASNGFNGWQVFTFPQ